MKRLYDFQQFDRDFFYNLDLAVVSENTKEDRKTITVIILQDRNIYKNGETGVNNFNKFYINIISENFKSLTFKQGDTFDMEKLEPNFDVVQFGESWDRKISLKGKYIE